MLIHSYVGVYIQGNKRNNSLEVQATWRHAYIWAVIGGIDTGVIFRALFYSYSFRRRCAAQFDLVKEKRIRTHNWLLRDRNKMKIRVCVESLNVSVRCIIARSIFNFASLITRRSCLPWSRSHAATRNIHIPYYAMLLLRKWRIPLSHLRSVIIYNIFGAKRRWKRNRR